MQEIGKQEGKKITNGGVIEMFSQSWSGGGGGTSTGAVPDPWAHGTSLEAPFGGGGWPEAPCCQKSKVAQKKKYFFSGFSKPAEINPQKEKRIFMIYGQRNLSTTAETQELISENCFCEKTRLRFRLGKLRVKILLNEPLD